MLASVNSLVWVLRLQGKYKAAEEINLRVLEGTEKALGREYIDILDSAYGLSLTLLSQAIQTPGPGYCISGQVRGSGGDGSTGVR
jgi:hypothetical protein